MGLKDFRSHALAGFVSLLQILLPMLGTPEFLVLLGKAGHGIPVVVLHLIGVAGRNSLRALPVEAAQQHLQRL